MDNNKKLVEGLLKADGIDPVGATESERVAFGKMLDEKLKSYEGVFYLLQNLKQVHLY